MTGNQPQQDDALSRVDNRPEQIHILLHRSLRVRIYEALVKLLLCMLFSFLVHLDNPAALASEEVAIAIFVVLA